MDEVSDTDVFWKTMDNEGVSGLTTTQAWINISLQIHQAKVE